MPNAPFFDFVTGQSVLVTVTTGGNPSLAPERRQTRTAGVSWKPIKARELRLNLDYVETEITDQTGTLGSVTPAVQAAFPDRFVRDAGGRLLGADLRPVTLAGELQRKLEGRVTLWTPIGPEPPPPAKGAPPPRPRPMIYGFATVTANLEDRLTLRRGQPLLDLLDGQTLDGAGGRPRYEAQGNLGGSWGPVQGGVFAMWQPPTRIRSDIAASDLHFSARTFTSLYGTLDAERLAPHAHWAGKLSFRFEVQNLLGTRVAVRDRDGATPYRYQRALIDPYGRIVKLWVRKLF